MKTWKKTLLHCIAIPSIFLTGHVFYRLNQRENQSYALYNENVERAFIIERELIPGEPGGWKRERDVFRKDPNCYLERIKEYRNLISNNDTKERMHRILDYNKFRYYDLIFLPGMFSFVGEVIYIAGRISKFREKKAKKKTK